MDLSNVFPHKQKFRQFCSTKAGEPAFFIRAANKKGCLPTASFFFISDFSQQRLPSLRHTLKPSHHSEHHNHRRARGSDEH